MAGWTRLGGLALLVVALNLPFGYWREGTRRYSLPWLAAIHAPVPVVILLRLLAGVGWQLASFPILIGAFFTGQQLGARLRRRRRRAATWPGDAP
jgi:hypothetical protein